MHTYFQKNAVFDLDVTFETKTPVDTKEALHFNKLPCILLCVGEPPASKASEITAGTVAHNQKSLTTCKVFEKNNF